MIQLRWQLRRASVFGRQYFGRQYGRGVRSRAAGTAIDSEATRAHHGPMAMTRESSKALLAIVGTGRFESKEGVAHSVVNRILDLVRTGMLRAGDRLPSEREQP